MSFASARTFVSLGLAGLLVAACGGSTPSTDNDAGTQPDGSTPPPDGSSPTDSGASDAPSSPDTSPDPADGPPTRQACTGSFGTGLTLGFGRMDGYLVSIIAPGAGRNCNGDSSHVHLQVKIQSSIYDVAVNIDTYQETKDLALPDGAWSEGWHTGISLDYTSLGLHSADFPANVPAQAAQAVEAFLANANHVSIFATGYGATGAHDVHRSTSANHNDGAIFIDPTSATPHAMFFRFSTETF